MTGPRRPALHGEDRGFGYLCFNQALNLVRAILGNECATRRFRVKGGGFTVIEWVVVAIIGMLIALRPSADGQAHLSDVDGWRWGELEGG
jgi:hypothetical protein